MIRRLGVAGFLLAAVACATPGSVRRVETQVAVLRAETARQDSARAAELARIIRLQQTVLDSLAAGRQALHILDARLGNDLVDIQRQLLQVQELTGQSQARLSRLQAQLDARAAAAQTEIATAMAGDSARTDSTPAAPASAASADQMYQGALQQYRRGSVLLARRAFLDFLSTYPNHPLVPDATYFVGETFETQAPDSALLRYREVVERFPQSARAPTALYKIGLMAERRNDSATARATYQRLMQQYPRTSEADLARDRLASLKP